MYNIGQVSKMFNLPISTLRYYDKEGLFPNLQRQSGIRKFNEQEIEILRVIECLKKSGLEIKDIKLFIQLCGEGSSSYQQRKSIFEKQLESVKEEMKRMQQVEDMLLYKCWYYTEVMKDGNEERVNLMGIKEMPADIKKAYQNSHGEMIIEVEANKKQ